MENNEILEDQWDNDSALTMKQKRGSFLLVLCILSWIYMGSSIISTTISYFNGTAELEKQLSKTSNAFDQETGVGVLDNMMGAAEEIMYKTIENFNEIQLGTLVGLLIGIMAVYLMFQLKKIGFALYVLYSMIIPAISLYFIGTSMIMLLGLAFNSIVSIAFIIMYGVNLKRMTE